MVDSNSSILPSLSPEHRRVVVGQFERAKQVLATNNYDYAIRLLLSCCKLDPANLMYRQILRGIEKTKYKNNLRGSWLAGLFSWPTKAKLKAAKQKRDYLKVLEHGEVVLVRNPWDTGVQIDMAEAADVLGLLDVAVWILEQSRQKSPKDSTVNRNLARLYEKRGNFAQAIAVWELVRKANPKDAEAQNKAKDLAASETIARGKYEEIVKPTAANDATKPAAVLDETAKEEIDTTSATSASTPTPVPRSSPTQDRVSREAASLQAKIAADPTNANVYLHLALLYRRADRLEQAREVLQQGLGPTGNAFELAIELAELEIEPFRQNLGLTEEKLRSKPDDEELRKIRVRLLKEINTRELNLFRQKSDRYPTEMVHRFELGVRLLRGGQVEEAIRELQVVRTDPRHQWRALFYLGSCFKSRNNWRLAKRNFEEALQALPSGEDAARKEILFQLAQGSADAGDLASAVDLGHELANLDFSYRDIGNLLDGWQTRMQQADISG